ncbi:MAG TPA: hypothetical protein VNO52_14755 [Methylomirabilota bacterium]|nr:hypothetical protein [Methylomirabilota bacterium]
MTTGLDVAYHKFLDRGEAGDNVGLLLRAAKGLNNGTWQSGARIPWENLWNSIWEPNWGTGSGQDYNHYAGVER